MLRKHKFYYQRVPTEHLLNFPCSPRHKINISLRKLYMHELWCTKNTRHNTRQKVIEEQGGQYYTGYNVLAPGEPPSKYLLTELDILDFSDPRGSLKYFKL